MGEGRGEDPGARGVDGEGKEGLDEGERFQAQGVSREGRGPRRKRRGRGEEGGRKACVAKSARCILRLNPLLATLAKDCQS